MGVVSDTERRVNKYKKVAQKPTYKENPARGGKAQAAKLLLVAYWGKDGQLQLLPVTNNLESESFTRLKITSSMRKTEVEHRHYVPYAIQSTNILPRHVRN